MYSMCHVSAFCCFLQFESMVKYLASSGKVLWTQGCAGSSPLYVNVERKTKQQNKMHVHLFDLP